MNRPDGAFCEIRTISIAQASARYFVRVFGSMRALHQCLSTVASPECRSRIHDLRRGTHRQRITDRLMTSEPDRRGQLKGSR
jgi:hypothetical protein